MFGFFTTLLLIFSSLRAFQSQQLLSINNATIPILVIKDTVDIITYEKASKNTSASIFLEFQLKNLENESPKNIELKINNKTTQIDIIDLIDSSNQKIASKTSSKIQIELLTFVNNSVLLKIVFGKLESVKIGRYEICLDVNSQKRLCESSFILSPPIVAKFSKAKLGLEGDPLRITCLFEASLSSVINIRWSLVEGDNLTTATITNIESNGHYEVREGRETKKANDTLVINRLFKNDSGIYMCTVFTELGSDRALVKINVKDRWAALYPFIGIVIEVIILVVAILAYEKYQIRSQNRKNKNYDENGYDDGKEAGGIPLSAGGGDEDAVVVVGENGGVAGESEGGEKGANSADLRQREAITKNV